MITPGNSYILSVVKIVDFGAFLDGIELGEILLPQKQCPSDLSLGHSLKVFVYLDSEDRPIATLLTPKAEVGEFAYLEVVATTKVGAFLDWGLDKDILVPFSEQHRELKVGQSYIVYLFLNPVDDRIVASSKIDRFLKDDTPHDFKTRQPVNLIIANTTDLGYKAIINHSHWGVLYNNEIRQSLSFGDYKTGYIKYIRPDGKIDLSLGIDKQTRDRYSNMVLAYLKSKNGFAKLHDKSDPKLITAELGMSKKSFKKAIGGLYKQKVISIESDGIKLIEQ
ncbi:MAG: putative RNA-binding protein (virulence factor B family) [Flavobacterium sp.]